MKKIIPFTLLFALVFNSHASSHDSTSVIKNSLKITFLSWFTGSTKISYERLFDNQALEFTSGIIMGGVTGYDGKKNQPKGFTLRLAHKFFQWGLHKHSLNGPYLKQELIYSDFSYTDISSERQHSNMGALFGCFGYQWLMNKFSVDGFLGIGGALGVPADTHYQHGFIIWDFFNTYNEHIALTFGVKLGYCF